MLCTQCKEAKGSIYAVVWVHPGNPGQGFCSRVCLRAWLEASGGLTAANPSGEISGPSPQPIVVLPSEYEQQPGESEADYDLRIYTLAILKRNLDR